MAIFTNQLLIQVVPRLQPGRCGVSDQAILLASELKTAFGISTAFIVLNSNEPCNIPFPVIRCAPPELQKTCSSLKGDRPGTILVHLSGYGYSADGAPTLLAAALKMVRASEQFRIAVYFHELFASGKPWRSAFWYSHRQRKAVRNIAEECDLLVTNTEHHAEWLEREPVKQTATPVQILPVFSAVGETRERVLMAGRERVMAVFGLAATRQRAYKALLEQARLLSDLGIQEILDIGQEFNVPCKLHGIPVRRMGELAAGDLSGLFSRTMFGFVQYASFELAKSSVFASFCSQGTIPVLATPFSELVDGLKDGVHLISPQTAADVLSSGLERCSAEAWRWYSAHGIHVHAATYAKWLRQACTERGLSTRAITGEGRERTGVATG